MDTNTNTRKFRYIPRNEILYGAPEVTEPYEKKKPSETLTERFRELAIIRFNRAFACCGMFHNAEIDLCGT